MSVMAAFLIVIVVVYSSRVDCVVRGIVCVERVAACGFIQEGAQVVGQVSREESMLQIAIATSRVPQPDAAGGMILSSAGLRDAKVQRNCPLVRAKRSSRCVWLVWLKAAYSR